jgi:hypothetical protein
MIATQLGLFHDNEGKASLGSDGTRAAEEVHTLEQLPRKVKLF